MLHFAVKWFWRSLHSDTFFVQCHFSSHDQNVIANHAVRFASVKISPGGHARARTSAPRHGAALVAHPHAGPPWNTRLSAKPGRAAATHYRPRSVNHPIRDAETPLARLQEAPRPMLMRRDLLIECQRSHETENMEVPRNRIPNQPAGFLLLRSACGLPSMCVDEDLDGTVSPSCCSSCARNDTAPPRPA
jgi:hypothetical protein